MVASIRARSFRIVCVYAGDTPAGRLGASDLLRTGAGAKPDVELHVGVFGITQGTPVDGGFVFMDGEYLEPPYVVSRRGMGIFINGKMIIPPFVKWPRPKEESTLGEIHPALPQQIDAATSPYDPTLTRYLKEKSAYLVEHYRRQEAVARMVKVYQELPCVSTTKCSEKDSTLLVVTWSDGSVDNVRLLLPMGRRIRWDKRTVIEHLERCRKNYEDRLGRGDTFFFWRDGGYVTGGIGFVRTRMPKMLRVLRSRSSDEVKVVELARPGVLGWPEEDCRRLVTTFRASPGLDQRVAEAAARYEEEDHGSAP